MMKTKKHRVACLIYEKRCNRYNCVAGLNGLM